MSLVETMSSEEKKPTGYINVVADLTLLQRIVCCNHDISLTPADTPRNRSRSEPTTIVKPVEEIELSLDRK